MSASREAMGRVRDIASGPDRPVLMLNVNRYRPDAGFPDGDAYRTYMDRLHHAVGAGGGEVLWRTPVEGQVIGCEHDVYDEILAVWYPSHAAFLALPRAEGAELMFESRAACVEHATILALPGDRFPLQPAG